jgi:molybdopterin-containing oxidoreductase family membrane subunit
MGPAEQHPRIMAPLLSTGAAFWRWVLILGAVVVIAMVALGTQLRYGLGVTNLNRPVYWGLYITNFVFFVGMSYGGVLTSAILRLVDAEWRRPITRMAEVVAVLALIMGVANIILDLGRPDRGLFVLLHPHFASPLLWDVLAISLYFVVSSVYLYLPLIPDIALLRDRTTGWRGWLYRLTALGFTGTTREWHRLELVIGAMAVGIIPIAVSVHTVVGWVFSMTIQPMWHSTIFGPYFVLGAIYSGLAALIITMAIVRKAYGLEGYLTPLHFNNLGVLLLVVACLWFYFTFAEFLTTFYGQDPTEMAVFNAKLFGPFAFHTWAMFVACFVVPFPLLVNRRTRTVAGTVIASVFICAGMWLERYTIVVPSLLNPRVPVQWPVYVPSGTELTLMAGCFAAFALLYMGFTKLYPIISIWELQHDSPAAPAVDTPGGDTIARALASGGHATRTVPGLARTGGDLGLGRT